MRGPSPLALAAGLLVLIGSACGSGGPGTTPSSGAPSASASPGPSPSASLPGGSFDPSAVHLALHSVAGGFSSPLLITNAGDGSGRIFVVEQGGTIRILEDGRTLPDPFLDVSDLVIAGGEQGLLGMAFHPDYRENGRFFIAYTDVQGDDVVAEYRRSTGDADRADPSSARIVLDIEDPFGNHNGGNLAFGPDGYLWIGTGDGGSAGDPFGNGQSLKALLGKMLRLDVDHATGGAAYAIPPDNPFVGRGDARPEIWAYGLRNPWRYSFDGPAGTIWIGDVGQGAIEEVDRASVRRAGLNYGWNVMEGDTCYGGTDCDRSGKTLPITEYTHDDGCTVVGGYVYRGGAFPALAGGYLFADYCSGTIFGIDAAGPRQDPTVLLETDHTWSSFGVDGAGELYLTDLASGEILQVTAT